MSTDAPQTTMSPVRRIGAIGLIFALVGPPVGGFVFLTGRAAVSLLSTQTPDFRFETFMYFLFGVLASGIFSIAAIPYSFIYGIVPASAAGLVIGTLQLKYGALNSSVVLVVGACIGVIHSFALSRVIRVTGSPINTLLPSSFGAVEYILVAVSCLIATVTCWRFARSFPA